MVVPSSQKSAVLVKPLVSSVIQERAIPSIGPNEVLIKITASAINPIDWKIRDDDIPLVKTFPTVLGSDAAGVIAGVGAAVKGFAEGDRVFFQGIIDDIDASTFQQYCKMPAALVGHTPANVSDEEAAGISLAAVVVVTGFYDHSGQGFTAPWDQGGQSAGRGKAAIIIGGPSSVGQYAIQLARLSGFEKIITNSSSAHVDHLKALGATDVLDRSKSTAKDYKDATEGAAVGFVFDAISSSDTMKLGVDILREFGGGDVVTVLATDPSVADYAKDSSGSTRIVFKHVLGIGSFPELAYLVEPFMRVLGGENGWLATGKFIPNRAQVIPGGLEAVEDALEVNKKGTAGGYKVVIKP